jgi:hypothetical protein
MNNLGVFLNNTNSELKVSINLHNYNILKSNFNSVIISDIDNTFSQKLKDVININNFNFNNDRSHFNKIVSIFNNINNYEQYDYITFIQDDYIYLNHLKEYFDYVMNHELDFYSYTDSTETTYHFQLYLITIHTKKIKIFLDYLNNKSNLLNLHNIFETKMPFLKIAYNLNNNQKNIFYNEDIYQHLFKLKLLQIIDLNKILKDKEKYKFSIFHEIPENFDINIYSNYDDLKNYNKDQLYNHFINYGQFEFRKYSADDYILPLYMREELNSFNIIKYLDLPNDFDIYKFRENNKNLKHLNRKELIINCIDNLQ